MDFSIIILTAIGLSIDGFAVSIIYGSFVKKEKLKLALKLSIVFGFFHFIMPLLGFVAGTEMKIYIEHIDHWIAFFLLLIVGGRMIYEGKSEEKKNKAYKTDLIVVIYLALATGMDALAVGFSLNLVQIPIIQAVSMIGISAFLFSFLGVWFGQWISKKINFGIHLVGGTILILIGIKILTEHLFL